MRKVLLSFLLLFALLLGNTVNSANAASMIPYIEVNAKIDGSDWFELTDNTWRWQHRYYALPEYHDGSDPTTVSFNSNIQSFFSSWPYGTHSGAYSEYNNVVGLEPLQNIFGPNPNITLNKLSGRGSVSIDQLPSNSNNYTLRVFIDDDGYGSHDFYKFEITGQPVPEPTSIFLGLISLLCGIFGFKRKF